MRVREYLAALSYGSGNIIWYIHNNPGCNQKEIIAFMGKSQPSISTMLTTMVRLGLVKQIKKKTEHHYSTTDLYTKVSVLFNELNEV